MLYYFSVFSVSRYFSRVDLSLLPVWMSEETIFVLICKLRTCEFVYEVKEREKEKKL